MHAFCVLMITEIVNISKLIKDDNMIHWGLRISLSNDEMQYTRKYNLNEQVLVLLDKLKQ